MRKTYIMFVFLLLTALAAGCRGRATPRPDKKAPPVADSSKEWMDPVALTVRDAHPPEGWSWDTDSSLIADPQVVAVIGNRKIPRAEFLEELDRQYHEEGLKELIRNTLWNQEAKRLGITVSEEDARRNAGVNIDRQLDTDRRNITRRFGNKITYEQYIRQRTGKTIEQYRRGLIDSDVLSGNARISLLVARLVAVNALTSGSTKFRHILCSTEEKAKDILVRLTKKNAPFEHLVELESEDMDSRSLGGELLPFQNGDWEYRKDLKALGVDFCKTVFTAPEGIIRKPVKSELGFNVVEVLEKKRPGEAAWADIADEVDELVKKGLTRTDLALWQARLAHKAAIDRTGGDGGVAVVNGKKISTADLHGHLTKRYGMDIVRILVETELLALGKTQIGLKNTEEEIKKMAEKIVADFLDMWRSDILYRYPRLRMQKKPLEYVIKTQYDKSLSEYTKELVAQKIEDGTAEKELTGAKISVFYLLTTQHIRVRHILLKNVHQAKAAWYKLKTAADFDLLARKESIADEMLPDGALGELLPFNRQEQPYRDDVHRYGRAFLEVAYATKRGAHSGVFQSEAGWHIIKVLDRWPSRPDAQYDELKDDIMKEITQRSDDRWMVYRPIWIKLAAEKTGVAIALPENFD